MRERIEARLESLRAEFTSGQGILAELEAREANVRQTLVRISGAIQVMEELLRVEDADAAATRTQEPVAVA